MVFASSLLTRNRFTLIIFAASVGLILYHVNVSFSPVVMNSVPHDKYELSHANFHGEDYSNSFQDGAPDDDPFGKVNFDINGSDVLVFLDMQKTGSSTFGRSLVNDLVPKCSVVEGKKERTCLRPNSKKEWWIFSRFSTGWLCGLHADWTALHEGVADKMDELEGAKKERKYFYTTLLRHPFNRFLSEWKHVQRGATWNLATFDCNARQNRIPRCFKGPNWINMTLNEFMSCPYNMGINRQTRMLADLRLVNCYEKWLNKNITSTRLNEIENQMFESAKKNLLEMSYFGILEERRRSQELFEYVFPLKFRRKLIQRDETIASNLTQTKNEIDEISKLNLLDVKLYNYATKLFEKRYEGSVGRLLHA